MTVMVGIDRDVLEAQRAVLADARELHHLTYDEAVHLEARARDAEVKARQEADRALATADVAHEQIAAARRIQDEQRQSVRACSADLAEIDEILATIPGQRRRPG